MLPLKLTLHNFMCYGEDVPPLSFEGIPLACLCGDNGHGKSALLDAITWALWGKARADNDALVHYGRQDMAVALEFAVGPNRYRVLRRHERPRGPRGSGKTAVELQVFSDGGLRALSGASLRETQGQINRLLHLDYDTFVNSAFLRQGQADSFAIKRPGERKALLGEILALSSYDELEQQARNRAREREAEAAALSEALATLAAELGAEEELSQEQRQINADLAELESYIEIQEIALEDLREHLQDHLYQKAQLEESQRRLAQADGEISRLQAQTEEGQRQIAVFQAVLAARDEVETGYIRLLALRRDYETQNRSLAQLHLLETQRSEQERAIAQARAGLEKEQAVLENRWGHLTALMSNLPNLKQELADTVARERGLAEQEKRVKERREASVALQGQVQGLCLANAHLKEEMQALRQKVDMLAEGEALCPLCGTELGADGREHIRREYNLQGEERRDAFRGNERELARLEKEAERVAQLLKGEETQFVKESAGLKAQVQTLERRLEEARAAEVAATQVQGQLDEVRATLAGEDYATEHRWALAATMGEIKNLPYDPEAHHRLGEEVVALEPLEERRRELTGAQASLEKAQEALAQAQAALGQWQDLRKDESGRISTMELALMALPTLQADLEGAQEALRQMHDERGALQRALGGLEERLARLATVKSTREQKTAALAQASRERDIYWELARAFGKDGIQALLIEAALPEVEEDANRLLGRMTDNRVHLKLETQRQTREGKTAETLDIHISDEMGTRPYETFSGGEAFRINFALRVALSRLLARRAGAPLPTLFIDEGFGTQDASGRERLIEAINAIAPDFERIIVITHMEEIKEAFPVRIEVFKDENGCRVTVS